MDILVRQKPVREEKQGDFTNDVDSDDDDRETSTLLHSELLGGMGEIECEVDDETEGDPTVRRQAYVKFDLQECKAMVKYMRMCSARMRLDATNKPTCT